MAHEAYPYIAILGLLAILSLIFGMNLAAVLFALLILFVVYFFRDPERAIPVEPGVIVAPADGRITKVERLDPNAADSAQLVSIFLSPLDVHINRAPIAGRISQISHIKGRFVSATRPESSLVNEQNLITIEDGGVKVIIKQIAGVIARRCVLWKQEGEQVALGERLGLIKFSSRTDLILPPEFSLLVRAGDRVRGGVTIIGRKKA
ncbi:MAG: phosphatidylserine decarboxylase [Acidobacteriota bacterium]